MTSVLDRLSKLPRYIKIIATNGIDENTAIVDNDKDRIERKRVISLNHYYRHREERLKEQRNYYKKNKQRLLDYSHNYYSINMDSILEKKKIKNQRPHLSG